MIINYTKKSDSYVAQCVKDIIGEEIYHADIKINATDTSPLFSETPYFLIADYDMLCKAKSLVTMGRTQFSGSKILYVLFIDDKPSKHIRSYHSFAKSICAVKGMVLFGCDFVQTSKEDQAVFEQSVEKCKKLACFARDSIPFIDSTNLAYPTRC